MKRLASRLSPQLILALAAFITTPAALAGSDILKCVDSTGHVTLTDQPCDTGSHGTRLLSSAAPEAVAAESSTPVAEPQGSTVRRYQAPQPMLRHQAWRPGAGNPDRLLARDVATLKAARAQLLLIDADRQPRTRLASR